MLGALAAQLRDRYSHPVRVEMSTLLSAVSPSACVSVCAPWAGRCLVAVALFLTACSPAFDEAEEDGQEAGASPPLREAGIDSGVAMPPDAQPDAQPEASLNTQPDAAVDADIDAEAGLSAGGGGAAPNFCDTVTKTFSTLCTNLETGPLVSMSGGFDWFEGVEPVLVTDGTKASGKRVMKSQLNALVKPENVRAVWAVEDSPSSVYAAFDFLPTFTLPPGTAPINWYKVQQPIEATGADAGGVIYYDGVTLQSRSDGTFLVIETSDGSAPSAVAAHSIATPFPKGWFRVEVSVKYGTAATVVVKYDGVAVLQLFNQNIPGHTKTHHQLGLYTPDPAGISSALYDNVLLDGVK
jgi:hypothetical protein